MGVAPTQPISPHMSTIVGGKEGCSLVLTKDVPAMRRLTRTKMRVSVTHHTSSAWAIGTRDQWHDDDDDDDDDDVA